VPDRGFDQLVTPTKARAPFAIWIDNPVFLPSAGISIRLPRTGGSVKPPLQMLQGFSKVFLLFPSPPQKRVKERVAGWARSRPTGNTLFY